MTLLLCVLLSSLSGANFLILGASLHVRLYTGLSHIIALCTADSLSGVFSKLYLDLQIHKFWSDRQHCLQGQFNSSCQTRDFHQERWRKTRRGLVFMGKWTWHLPQVHFPINTNPLQSLSSSDEDLLFEVETLEVKLLCKCLMKRKTLVIFSKKNLF